MRVGKGLNRPPGNPPVSLQTPQHVELAGWRGRTHIAGIRKIAIIGANFTLVFHASIWVADDLLAPELGPISESQVELMQQSDTGEPSWPGWRRDHAAIVFGPYRDT